MPDPILRAVHIESAKARQDIDAADAAIRAQNAALSRARTELGGATLRGDLVAANRASQAIDRGERQLVELTRQRRELDARLGRILDRLEASGPRAPAELPLLLLPLRLETRFSPDRSTLQIRIFPDAIHVDALDRGLSSEEQRAGQAYWAALWQGGEVALEAAWATLLNAVGERRAMWVAHALTPTNLASHGTSAAPEFPASSAPADGVARARLLPEYFHVTAHCAAKVLRARGARVADEVRIGLLSRDNTPLISNHGLKVVAGTEWLSDYAVAKSMGLAIDLPLAGNQRIDKLFVVGIVQSREPQAASAALTAQLESHWAARGLAFVPQGTPTNNSESDPAGWQRRIAPRPVPLVSAPVAPQSNAAVLRDALDVDARWLGSLAHAEAREQAGAEAMNAALWPATWGYFLDTLNQGDADLSTLTVDRARTFYEDHVRGRGPIPALRVGDQPYGVLPVTATSLLKGAANDAFERDLVEMLTRVLPHWRAGVADLPHVGKAPGLGDQVPAYMTMMPLSFGVRARRCLSGNMRDIYGTTSETGKEAAVTEAFLSQLVSEALGNISYVYGPAALDARANPVLLPYADPARDAAFLAALLAGTPPASRGPVSSIFQALAAVAWGRVEAEAAVPTRFSEVARATSTLTPALTNRIVGAVAPASPTDRAEIERLISALPGANEATARPSLRSIQVLESERGELLQSALQATSAAERDYLGVLVVDGVLRGQQRRASVSEGFQTLIEEAAAGASDFSLLVAEALDTASHRLDAWLTAVSHRRLTALRKAGKRGLTIGAFGWLENIEPKQGPRNQGGFVAAPAMSQAVTAGILRSAYLSHDGKNGEDSAFAIDLSSQRVRDALYLLQGVREGQPLGALLGYNFERQLHESQCDRFILSFRGIAPLIQQRLTDLDDQVLVPAKQTIAAANVTDMLKLAEKWRVDGKEAIFTELAKYPEGNEFLDPQIVWTGPSAAEKGAITAAIEKAMTDADAVADLMLAEAVHQMASGNPRRAAVALDAAGKGEVAPPDPDFISSKGPSAVLTHRVVTVLPSSGGWSSSAPRALVAPRLEHWAGRRLGDPSKIVVLNAGGRRHTLADARLAALDFVLLSASPAVLERFVRSRLGALENEAPLLEAEAPGLAADELAYGDALLLAQALGATLTASRPADELTFALPAASTFRPADGAVEAAVGRLSTVLGILGDDLTRLEGLIAQGAVEQAQLEQALAELAELGLFLPAVQDRSGPELALFVLAEGERRAKSARALLDANPTRIDQLDQIAKVLFGQELVMPIAFVFDAALSPDAMLGQQAIPVPSAGAVSRVLADWAAVRPALGSWQKARLLGGAFGLPVAPRVGQLHGRGRMEHDTWLGAGLDPNLPTPTAPVVSLIAEAAEGLDLTLPIEALLIDEWNETLPERVRRGEAEDAPVDTRVTAGVALHADAPNAQPAQTLLLALSPDGSDWDADRLVKLLSDTLDLARIRLVALETLPMGGRVLPAIYTQTWSLQGEPVPDWRKIAVAEISEIASVAGVKNFAMTKEG